MFAGCYVGPSVVLAYNFTILLTMEYFMLSTATHCTAKQHACINGEQCVSRSDRCDGKVDCMDGSDEFLCRK